MLERTPNFFTARHHAMHVPRTMFAAAIGRFGGPEVITPHALPVPAVDAGEVLIAVDTAGVGRWDADVREGYFAARKPHFPMVLGFDGAGVVAAVGSRVRRLRVGDEVYSYNWQNPKGGFYAEYVAVPADKAARCAGVCHCIGQRRRGTGAGDGRAHSRRWQARRYRRSGAPLCA